MVRAAHNNADEHDKSGTVFPRNLSGSPGKEVDVVRLDHLQSTDGPEPGDTIRAIRECLSQGRSWGKVSSTERTGGGLDMQVGRPDGGAPTLTHLVQCRCSFLTPAAFVGFLPRAGLQLGIRTCFPRSSQPSASGTYMGSTCHVTYDPSQELVRPRREGKPKELPSPDPVSKPSEQGGGSDRSSRHELPPYTRYVTWFKRTRTPSCSMNLYLRITVFLLSKPAYLRKTSPEPHIPFHEVDVHEQGVSADGRTCGGRGSHRWGGRRHWVLDRFGCPPGFHERSVGVSIEGYHSVLGGGPRGRPGRIVLQTRGY